MGESSKPKDRLVALDFTALLRRNNVQDFVGRGWILEEIERWTSSAEGAGMFLLTGQPGVGKSAIAAHVVLTNSHVVAYHFCVAGRVETIVPATVLRSLAAQLGARLPGYGEALANTVKPTHLTVNVDIQVGAMTGGQITGVVINHLTALDPQTELEVLLRAPLAAMPAPEKPCLVVIDSLDEAVTVREGPTLVNLLSDLHGLPGWLRLLCTSRPDQRVLSYFEHLDPRRLDAESPLNQDDVRLYVTGRVGKAALKQRLSEAGQTEDPFISFLAGTSDSQQGGLAAGNFLYAKILLDDIESGRQCVVNLGDLPRSLDGIYHGFLRRFTDTEWIERFLPVFGLLAVGREPLTEAQLATYSGQKRTMLRQNLGVVRQFLAVDHDTEGNETFALFHQSLREYLLDGTRSDDFLCAGEDYHEEIARAYLTKQTGQWSTCDLYGLRHLPAHLAGAGKMDEFQTLLLSFDWLQTKLDKLDIYALLGDYELGSSFRARKVDSLKTLHDALRRSADALARDKGQLPGQLIGRLMAVSRPEIRQLLEEAARTPKEGSWLRPLTASLAEERSVRWLSLSDRGSVYEIVFSQNGLWAAHESSDMSHRRIVLWDLKEWKLMGPVFGVSAPWNPYALAISDDACWCLYSDSVGGVHRSGKTSAKCLGWQCSPGVDHCAIVKNQFEWSTSAFSLPAWTPRRMGY